MDLICSLLCRRKRSRRQAVSELNPQNVPDPKVGSDHDAYLQEHSLHTVLHCIDVLTTEISRDAPMGIQMHLLSNDSPHVSIIALQRLSLISMSLAAVLGEAYRHGPPISHFLASFNELSSMGNLQLLLLSALDARCRGFPQDLVLDHTGHAKQGVFSRADCESPAGCFEEQRPTMVTFELKPDASSADQFACTLDYPGKGSDSTDEWCIDARRLAGESWNQVSFFD